jgi:multidrug efflux system outer membrane protein
MKIKGLVFCLTALLAGCTVTPEPISINDAYKQAQNNVKLLFARQKNFHGKLDFNQALARGLKYNLDFRIKRVNSALQAGQLELAKFTMFPALNTTGSVYTRNNDFSSFGVTSTGQPTDVLNSTPRTVRSLREGLSWNILDFGMGYVRAKQQGERWLIAKEEARKQLQQLAQDIRVSYWAAYSAQELLVDVKEFQHLLNEAKNDLEAAIHDKTIPQESILTFQTSIIEGNRRLTQLQYKFDKAQIDLKHLLNLPIDSKLVLEAPPAAVTKAQNLSNLNFRKLDAITLVSRPEIRSQNYQQRIAQLGVKAAIFQALPGVTLNKGWNYNSNKFLINSAWLDKSFDVSWNLLNLASLPTALDTAEAQIKYEKLKLMALTLTSLTETRYAYAHYQNLAKEYKTTHAQTDNAKAILTLFQNRERASLASKQQVIIAKLRYISAKMDQDLQLSDLSTALGELYLSAGCDFLPLNAATKPLPEATRLIKETFNRQSTMDFKRYIDYKYNKLFKSKRTKLQG